MSDDYKQVGASRKRQGDCAEIAVRVLLRDCLDLCAVSIKDGDVLAGTEIGDVGGSTGEGRLLKLCHV